MVLAWSYKPDILSEFLACRESQHSGIYDFGFLAIGRERLKCRYEVLRGGLSSLGDQMVEQFAKICYPNNFQLIWWSEGLAIF